MTAGFCGTFVIGCTQTEIDGIRQNGPNGLEVGAQWRWSGQAICLENAHDLLILGGAFGETGVRRRAGRRVRRLLGPLVQSSDLPTDGTQDPDVDGKVVVTDGVTAYCGTIIDLPSRKCLFVFQGQAPHPDRDHWIISVRQAAPGWSLPEHKNTKAMVCFAPGTQVSTPLGQISVETLGPGDLVDTRDDGPQPVLWAGYTDVSAEKLMAFPQMRPVCFNSGAYGPGAPGRPLIVSPDHRILVTGPAAQSLFQTSEVLVAASRLIDDFKVRRVPAQMGHRYHHLMFERHQIIWANGMACESFHPGDADLLGLPDRQRLGFIDAVPDVFRDVSTYGGHARRCLSEAEYAIMKHGL